MIAFDTIDIFAYVVTFLLLIPFFKKVFTFLIPFLYLIGFNLLSVSIVGYLFIMFGLPFFTQNKYNIIFALFANTILFIIGINSFSVGNEKVKKF